MRTTVSIPGLHCTACKKLICSVNEDFPVITDTTVDLAAKLVTIDHADSFDIETWTRAIEALGPAYALRTV